MHKKNHYVCESLTTESVESWNRIACLHLTLRTAQNGRLTFYPC
ncbi:unnamed protein product [Musa acuminata subsp. malaccensis]|uniref:(wild Malaysian banana) hypothetical protein n=1 Tax=Musa acuminata subsp. malaccensis TaxID=214687 RepID=A0A804HPT5_MUSAM|nr:unnamed protein product [Musa acuminata subsp. malaccensis]